MNHNLYHGQSRIVLIILVTCYCSDIARLEEDMTPFVNDASHDKELDLAVLEGDFYILVRYILFLIQRFCCLLMLKSIFKN